MAVPVVMICKSVTLTRKPEDTLSTDKKDKPELDGEQNRT